MSGSEEDLAPLQRLATALDALDARATDILAYHAAIERELDLALDRLLPNASQLRGLGFGHKVSVLGSLQSLDKAALTKIISPLLRFNDLRNSVAHGDTKKDIGTAMQRLFDAVPPLDASFGPPDLSYAAAFIFGTLNAKRFSPKISKSTDTAKL